MSGEDIAAKVAEIARTAMEEASSGDPLVQLVWIIQGLDLWHRSHGNMGHSFDDTVRYTLSRVLRLLRRDDEGWEYGTLCPEPVCTEPHPLRKGEQVEPGEKLMRRRPYREIEPGPWEPVPADLYKPLDELDGLPRGVVEHEARMDARAARVGMPR